VAKVDSVWRVWMDCRGKKNKKKEKLNKKKEKRRKRG